MDDPNVIGGDLVTDTALSILCIFSHSFSKNFAINCGKGHTWMFYESTKTASFILDPQLFVPQLGAQGCLIYHMVTASVTTYQAVTLSSVIHLSTGPNKLIKV